MNLYSEEKIRLNDIYGPLMRDLNQLYENLGSPEAIMPHRDMVDRVGKVNQEYWRSTDIGNWFGIEKDVCEYANQMLEQVYDGLALFGNGGIACLHVTAQWKEFVSLSLELLDDYHVNRAFPLLLGLKDVMYPEQTLSENDTLDNLSKEQDTPELAG